jgi:hypothetical protein
MKTTTNSTSNQDNGANGIFINLKGATEMTIATQIKKVKLGITNLVNNNTPARFLGALVLGPPWWRQQRRDGYRDKFKHPAT